MKVLVIRSFAFLMWVAFTVSQAWTFAENPKQGAGAREQSQAEQKPDPGSLQTIRSEIELMKAEYEKAGPEPSHTRYGYVVPNGAMDHSLFA